MEGEEVIGQEVEDVGEEGGTRRDTGPGGGEVLGLTFERWESGREGNKVVRIN